MIRFAGSVEFVDGRVEEFQTGNAALSAWERYAARHKLPTGKDSPSVLSSLVIAHRALAIAEGFDAWAETVDGVECYAVDGEGNRVKDEAEAVVPPTPQAASTV